MRPLKLIVPETPETLFDENDHNLLSYLGVTTEWMLEFIMAVWPVVKVHLQDDDFNELDRYLTDTLHSSLLDFSIDMPPEVVEYRYRRMLDPLMEMIKRVMEHLQLYVANLDVGNDQYHVEQMTYEPYVSDASIINIQYETERLRWINDELRFGGTSILHPLTS